MASSWLISPSGVQLEERPVEGLHADLGAARHQSLYLVDAPLEAWPLSRNQ